MIIHKMWRVRKAHTGESWSREGWFLFGFIPIYVKTTSYENFK